MRAHTGGAVWRTLLLLPFVAFAVSACSSEEEVSYKEAMTEELTIEEIVRRVVESGRAIDSYELETVRTTDKDGERSEERSRVIRVGGDSYEWSNRENALVGEEELTYKGQKYYREKAGDSWKTEEELGWLVLASGTREAFVEVDESRVWDETLGSETWQLDFNPFLEAERLEDQKSEGRVFIRLSTEESVPLTGPALEEMQEKIFPPSSLTQNSEGEVAKALAEFREQFAKGPDNLSLHQELFISQDDFRLHRVLVEGVASKEGVATESFVETGSYSRFNEAELPGPLPE